MTRARTASPGPQPIVARRAAKTVVVSFAGATGGLVTRGGPAALGFELCGAEEGSCRFADARVAGDTVVLADDGRPATRVRYAWSDSAAVNLFDAAKLPVGTFDLPIS